jgi:dienelactone hydrolase
VLALHDHGAHFTIGKEKTIRPVAATEEIINDSEDWVGKCYGGRFYGDELAKRGYVVLSGDALFWGERGRLEGADHKAQERFAANMFQLGTSWAGKILWDDMRYLEFLRAQPGVAPERVAAMGLSVGCYRTWSLCAATDDLKAGVAICWMGDTQALTTPGNNQTTGQSAFCMIHPDIRNWLDYPDVASLACPKPMLFYAGEKDGLFPVEGVNRAFAKLRKVWDDQGTGSRLETKLWPVPHEYNAEMQEEAFKWLDSQMKEQ